jgi:hypothetical protein
MTLQRPFLIPNNDQANTESRNDGVLENSPSNDAEPVSERPPAVSHNYTRTVHHGGKKYLATTTMADIFSAHAHDIIERGATELVPLLHKGGVDLLLITPGTVFAVASMDITGVRVKKAPAAKGDGDHAVAS